MMYINKQTFVCVREMQIVIFIKNYMVRKQ